MAKDLKAVVLFFLGLFVLGFLFSAIDRLMMELLGEHWLAIVCVVGVLIAAIYAAQPDKGPK